MNTKNTRITQRLIATALAFVIIQAFVVTTIAKSISPDLKSAIVEQIELRKVLQGKDGKLFAGSFLNGVGSTASDWYAFLVGRLGLDEDYNSYLGVMREFVEQKYAQNGTLDLRKATEWHRIALTALSLGANPKQFAKNGGWIDLVAEGTYSRPSGAPLGAQGSNAYIWALITLDSVGYKVPEGTRQSLIESILKYRCDDGGFALDGKNSDTDITAMVLQALAPYINSETPYGKNNEKMRDVINSALSYLSAVQHNGGGFSSMGVENSNSISQVIIALCALGIDPMTDKRFIKDKGLFDALLEYKTDSGSYSHKKNTTSDGISGDQVFASFVAAFRFLNGYKSLYDLTKEFTEDQKAQIEKLNIDILALSSSSETTQIEAVFENYLNISDNLKRYISAYPKLSDLLQAKNIENTAPSIEECMNQTDNAVGAITDVLSGVSGDTETVFTSNDEAAFSALPKELSTEYYNTLVGLIAKLQAATNKDEFEHLLPEMQNRKAELDELKAEIFEINRLISEKIYPAENITKNDAEFVKTLLERVNKLSEYDKNKLEGFDELQKASVRLKTLAIEGYATIAAVIILIVLAAIFVLRSLKRKKSKEVF